MGKPPTIASRVRTLGLAPHVPLPSPRKMGNDEVKVGTLIMCRIVTETGTIPCPLNQDGFAI